MHQSSLKQDSADKPPGTGPAGTSLLMGNYELLQELGSGGMGTVYLARHSHLKKLVAVKVIKPERTAEAEFLDRFRQEMEMAGRIDHHHIVRALDGGSVDGVYYLAMEFVPGCDVTRLLTVHKRLSVADACEMARQVASALAAINAHGMIHRDLKPSNLLLSESGQIKVLDLGLARLKYSGDALQSPEGLTGSHQILGTADYMSPEQIRSPRSVDIRSDLYALGCTLFQLLTGQKPFGGTTARSLMDRLLAHLNEPVPSVSHLRPDCPPEVSRLVYRLMQKSPADRLQTPEEVVAALTPWTAGSHLAALVTTAGSAVVLPEPVASQVSTVSFHNDSTRPLGLPRAHRRIVNLALLSMAGLLLIAAVGYLLSRTDDTVAPPAPAVLSPAAVPPAPVPPAPAPFKLDDLAPGESFDLLSREPVKLMWDWDSKLAKLNYDAEERTLSPSCNGVGLIELGETNGSDFQLIITLQQLNWTGGIGVFFNYRETPGDPDTFARFQYIDIRPRFEPQGNLEFERGLATLKLSPQVENPGFSREALGLHDVPAGSQQSHTLELTFQSGILIKVRCDSHILSHLTQEWIQNQVGHQSAQGRFGILLSHTSTAVPLARYRRSIQPTVP